MRDFHQLFDPTSSTFTYVVADYHGRTVSTIGEERRTNPRFAGKTRVEFIRLMDALDLPKPRLFDVAVAANQRLGLDIQQG